MARRLGVTPRECVGLTCHEIVHRTDHPPEFCPHAQTIEDCQEHAAEVFEERLGGSFLVTTTPLKEEDGGMAGVVHVARDISELKRAEESLKGHLEELKDTNNELERFNRVSVGRELRMIELKKEINELCLKIGEAKRYALEFEPKDS